MPFTNLSVYLHGNEQELKGATLYPRTFRKLHDLYYKRCACCFSKFIEEDCFGLPHQGFATRDDTIWVCDKCAERYGKDLGLHFSNDPTNSLDASVHPTPTQG